MKQNPRRQFWLRRKKRARKQLAKVERPLLTVYRSNQHIYAQIVDPVSGRTITGVSTRSSPVRDGLKSTKDREAAKRVGKAVGELALARKIEQVTFNRNGFVYTGRVKALADAAREAGLKF
jgi:large subunit ribosomal protein L18